MTDEAPDWLDQWIADKFPKTIQFPSSFGPLLVNRLKGSDMPQNLENLPAFCGMAAAIMQDISDTFSKASTIVATYSAIGNGGDQVDDTIKDISNKISQRTLNIAAQEFYRRAAELQVIADKGK